jgi:ABC-type antimicrobial peptide transport system, permease component
MELRSTLQMAWRSLLVNKMRSLLTMLGVIIGVASVIAMVALSQGATTGITERISSMGSNLLTISGGGGFGPVRGANPAQLTMEDVEAIKSLPLVKYVAPEASLNNATIAVGSSTWTANVDGTTPELMAIKNWPTEQGDFFDDYDLELRAPVAVLGQTVVSNLFPGMTSPVGQVIRINGLDFNVIGVLSTRGAAGMGQDQDNMIYIPLTTAQQRLLGSTSVRMINVQATSQEALTTLKDYITTLLRQRHRLAATAEDDFRIQDMAEVLSTVEDTTRMLTFLLGGYSGGFPFGGGA